VNQASSFVAALSVLVVLGCGAPSGSAPASSTPSAPKVSGPSRRVPFFILASDPWSNLQERLIAEATVDKYWHGPVGTCVCARAPDGAVLSEWTNAVAQYKKTFTERNYYTDKSLMRTTLELGLAGHQTALPPNVDKDLAGALRTTFDPYVRGQWPADDARNKAWIAAVEPLVAKWAAEIAPEIAKRLDITWPAEPIRVEVTQYAGFGGAYTISPPILTTMSSEDAGYAPPAALEMLFHEASHGLDGNLTHDLEMAYIAKGKRLPDWLAHAIIFYTAGEVVRRRLGASYVPYAHAQGVWKRGLQKTEAVLRTHWQRWLDDEIDLATALGLLVDHVPE
jgi:hypothetical protein